jgi:hypothetical protein
MTTSIYNNGLLKSAVPTRQEEYLKKLDDCSFEGYEEFKYLACKYYWVPKPSVRQERAVELAWEWGHAIGYQKVDSYLSDLVDLLELKAEPKKSK